MRCIKKGRPGEKDSRRSRKGKSIEGPRQLAAETGFKGRVIKIFCLSIFHLHVRSCWHFHSMVANSNNRWQTLRKYNSYPSPSLISLKCHWHRQGTVSHQCLCQLLKNYIFKNTNSQEKGEKWLFKKSLKNLATLTLYLKRKSRTRKEKVAEQCAREEEGTST